jgi:hypothetical protein
LDTWEQDAREDPTVLFLRARVELRAGAFGPALKAADEYLAKKPGDDAMIQLRKTILDRIAHQQPSATPPAPAKPSP